MRIAISMHRAGLLLALALIALTVGPATWAQASPHLVVNTSWLNVRTGPGVSHSIIDKVRGGTVLPVNARAANLTWYQVQSPFGTGYVNSNYTVKRGNFSGVPWEGAPDNLTTGTGPVPSIDARVIVNTSYLNVRQGPGVGYPVVAVVPGGTELKVVQISNGGHWYQVETAAGLGWLRHMYTVTRGNYDDVPQQGVSPHIYSVTRSAELGKAPHLVVNTAYMNVRSGPGVGHSILMVIPGGSRLLVTGTAGDGRWYEIETNAGPGWINSHYTAKRGDFSRVRGAASGLWGDAPRAIVNTARLNVRSGPGAGYAKTGLALGGTVLALDGVSADGLWYRAQGGFGSGWLHSGYLVTRGAVGSLPVAG